MPIQRQVLLAMGSLVILGFVLGAVYFVFLRQPDAILFSNLRAADAATIVADLDKKKVPYHLADGGATILVAKDKADATRLGILSEDLPLKGTVGFELFNKSDIGLTEFAQKINYQRALQGELARTIMAMDSVDTARVHLSLPDPTIFQDDKRPPKASIALTLKPGKSLPPASVRGIQRLVAAAVSDLTVSNVVVLDGDGQVISSDAAEADPSAQPAGSEAPAQHAAETYYSDKVRQALSATYPDRDFTVKIVAHAPDGQATPGSTGDDSASDGVFAAWTPELRKFPLKVTISDSLAETAEVARNVRVAAASAISENTELGDDIALTSQAAPADAGAPPTDTSGTHVFAKSQQAVTGQAAVFPWTAFWAAMAVVAVVGGIAAVTQLRRTQRAPRKLSESERREFVTRFQALLEQGEGDAGDRL